MGFVFSVESYAFKFKGILNAVSSFFVVSEGCACSDSQFWFQGVRSKDLRNDILEQCLMPLLVYLACQGTDLSRMWLLRDLEVCTIPLCTIISETVGDRRCCSSGYGDS